MKKCPRCNELIGDELEVCPVCHTEFTEKQLEEMKKAAESFEVQQLIREKKLLARFHKERVIMGSIMYSGLGLMLLSPLFFAYMFIEPMTVVSSSAFLLPQKLFLRGESLSISFRRSEAEDALEAEAVLFVLGAVKKPAMLAHKAPASCTKTLITPKRFRPFF